MNLFDCAIATPRIALPGVSPQSWPTSANRRARREVEIQGFAHLRRHFSECKKDTRPRNESLIPAHVRQCTKTAVEMNRGARSADYHDPIRRRRTETTAHLPRLELGIPLVPKNPVRGIVSPKNAATVRNLLSKTGAPPKFPTSKTPLSHAVVHEVPAPIYPPAFNQPKNMPA